MIMPSSESLPLSADRDLSARADPVRARLLDVGYERDTRTGNRSLSAKESD